jgi:extradiol dioxygenase family protein
MFHLSLPCSDIKATKDFYINSIGAYSGRESENWIDINLFDNQITFTKAGKFDFNNPNYVFEGKILPSFHFGVILDSKNWEKVYKRLNEQKLELVDKSIFLKDHAGEHSSFYVKDPNEYMLEFKCFTIAKDIFNK